MAAVTICSDFGAPQNKFCHCFHIYLSWSDGARCHHISFLNDKFQANFLTLSSTSIKKLFSFTFCHKYLQLYLLIFKHICQMWNIYLGCLYINGYLSCEHIFTYSHTHTRTHMETQNTPIKCFKKIIIYNLSVFFIFI